MPTVSASQIRAEHEPAELDVVRLLEPVVTAEGILPQGAEGTVVMTWTGRPSYCIEFVEPFQSIVDLHRSQIAVIWSP